MLNTYFADLHIHIGQDILGRPVKIAASKQLTLTNILKESSRKKGIDLIGIIDCHAPNVQMELKQLLREGAAYELSDGGVRFEQVTLIMGTEIEVYDANCRGPIHVLAFFPTLTAMEKMTDWLSDKMKNINLSSQRYYGSAIDLQKEVKALEGLFIPAHVFTPFKSLYGKGVQTSLQEVFDPTLIDAVELGLSSDSKMADQIAELHHYPYVTNSDSHSLAKIGREYQEISMQSPSFNELKKALRHELGREITANYGMNPKLGKYYTTVCQECFETVEYGTQQCPSCASKKIIAGVYDRIKSLCGDKQNKEKRPPYYYQVPLEYLPGLGPKTLATLLDHFGTEMNIIHHVPLEALHEVVPTRIASLILENRQGDQMIQAGGGGKYGKMVTTKNK